MVDPPPPSPPAALRALPPAEFLLALPALLAHPPNHAHYAQSLALSLAALRRCVRLPDLAPDVECRAWTALAEVGMQVVQGKLHEKEELEWASDVVRETPNAISKGLFIAQKHPALRAYWHRLSLLQASFAHSQANVRFARKALARLHTSFRHNDPPHFAYSTHLATIDHLLSPPHPRTTTTPTASQTSFASSFTLSSPVQASASTPNITPLARPPLSRQDAHLALASVATLRALASQQQHKHVALLATLLKLRVLVAADDWAQVHGALSEAEAALGMSYVPAVPVVRKGKEKENQAVAPPTQAVQPSSDPAPEAAQKQAESQQPLFKDPFEAAVAMHVVLIGIIYYTHTGSAAEATPRLAHLHAMLDGGALDLFPEGIVQVPIPNHPPLPLRTTHPRALYLLGYLASTAAKRDGVGRNPKRRVFALEGLRAARDEARREVRWGLWARLDDVDGLERTAAGVEADLMCELIAVSIMRSEFNIAEQKLDELIAHTRKFNLFDVMAPRITLHQAHLAHALGRAQRARDCYAVAADLAPPGGYVNVAARAGMVALQVGEKAAERAEAPDAMDVDGAAKEEGWVDEATRAAAMEVVEECAGMGGALEAVGAVLEACVLDEIVRAKSRLKAALDGAGAAGDNHARALTLALVAAYYLHTAGDTAEQMLRTCRQLAGGLGGPVSSAPAGAAGKGGVKPQPLGNAVLGLWVGERFLELHRRNGEDEKIPVQERTNALLAEAVAKLRATSLVGDVAGSG